MDAKFEKRIALKVFEEGGITIDRHDPVFALALICKEIVKEDKEDYIRLQEKIILTIRQIPKTVSESLDRVADAVEDAEQTAQELRDTTEDILNAISKSIVLETREALNTVARDQVAVALSQINVSFDALEVRAKKLGNEGSGKRYFWPMIAAAALLVLGLICLPPLIYYQVKLNDRQERESTFYLKELLALERSITFLPQATQENIKRLSDKEKASLTKK